MSIIYSSKLDRYIDTDNEDSDETDDELRTEEYKKGYNQAIKDFKIPNKFGEKSL